MGILDTHLWLFNPSECSQSEEGLVIVEEPNELQTKNELWGYTKIKYKINKDFCNCE